MGVFDDAVRAEVDRVHGPPLRELWAEAQRLCALTFALEAAVLATFAAPPPRPPDPNPACLVPVPYHCDPPPGRDA